MCLLLYCLVQPQLQQLLLDLATCSWYMYYACYCTGTQAQLQHSYINLNIKKWIYNNQSMFPVKIYFTLIISVHPWQIPCLASAKASRSMSHFICHLPPVTNANSHNNIPSPANSPIIEPWKIKGTLFLFRKGPFKFEALFKHWEGLKLEVKLLFSILLSVTTKYFLFGQNLFFVKIGFIQQYTRWIYLDLYLNLFFLSCKITQLQKSEMRPTDWTLSNAVLFYISCSLWARLEFFRIYWIVMHY